MIHVHVRTYTISNHFDHASGTHINLLNLQKVLRTKASIVSQEEIDLLEKTIYYI